MTSKTLTLAASLAMLVAISGNASAGADGSHTRHWTVVAGRSGQQLSQAFDAVDPATAIQTAGPNAHHYHGGPKSND
jgi:hypothetical protein